jgi:hypothetical protein
MELKKQIRAIDLAYSACLKRKSPRTGFVHLFEGDRTVTDTIPTYENFLFALACLRQKTAEAFLEGKELIQRLLAFQTADGNFPIYLHDFPKCWDRKLPQKIAPIFLQALRHFGPLLGADLKDKIERALRLMPPLAPPPSNPQSGEEWFDWIVQAQLNGASLQNIPYHRGLQIFTGNHGVQEGAEPKPLPIEWILAEGDGFSERLLRDHPEQIRAALLFPVELPSESESPILYRDSLRTLWKGKTLHSLFLPGGQEIDLPNPASLGRDDLIECAAYCDLSSETQIDVEGTAATVFSLGDTLRIATPHLTIYLRFDLVEGEGSFLGHLSHGNRPTQIACKGQNQFAAYDWQIALRTLRREGPCKLKIDLKLELPDNQ